MAITYDVHFTAAPDKKAREAFFNDGRIELLVSKIDNRSISYIGEVVYRFTTKVKFDAGFDDFETYTYNHTDNESIYDYSDYLRSIYKEANDGKLRHLRAAILERLVFQFKKPSYSDYTSWIETFVYINNKDFQSKSSIDVAAWCQRRESGECTECAVSERFVKDDEKKREFKDHQFIIKKISSRLNSYFVSFAMTAALQETVGKFTDIGLIGRDRLASFLGFKS